MERICIVGAGAIGGLIGTKLAAAGGAQVSALARGATLEALRRHGWRAIDGDTPVSAPAIASDRASELGAQDLVVIAVKGPALGAVASAIAPLLGPDTVVLPAMNGVPWWFGQGVAALGEAPLESVDPGGRIAAAIPLERVVGCVVHMAASMPEPGLARRHMGAGLIVGEPGGGRSPRVERLAAQLGRAGFDATVAGNIRYDVWYKLWGNLTMNPVSAITGATADKVLDDPLVRNFCSQAMREAATIGARLGCTIEQTPEDRHAVTRKLGALKTSMLQDVEAGRAIELDAIVGAVHELAQRLDAPAPSIAALLGLTRLFARERGLYPSDAPAGASAA